MEGGGSDKRGVGRETETRSRRMSGKEKKRKLHRMSWFEKELQGGEDA